MRKTFRILLPFIAAFGLIRNMPAAESVAPTVKAQQKAVRKAPADAAIEARIQEKLAKSKLAADHFTFSVTNGVATIEGTTSVMQHKGVMTRMAKSAGAVAVRNNIRISDAAKAKATASLAKARAKTGQTPKASVAPADPPKTEESSQVPHATVLPLVRER